MTSLLGSFKRALLMLLCVPISPAVHFVLCACPLTAHCLLSLDVVLCPPSHNFQGGNIDLGPLQSEYLKRSSLF